MELLKKAWGWCKQNLLFVFGCIGSFTLLIGDVFMVLDIITTLRVYGSSFFSIGRGLYQVLLVFSVVLTIMSIRHAKEKWFCRYGTIFLSISIIFGILNLPFVFSFLWNSFLWKINIDTWLFIFITPVQMSSAATWSAIFFSIGAILQYVNFAPLNRKIKKALTDTEEIENLQKEIERMKEENKRLSEQIEANDKNEKGE